MAFFVHPHISTPRNFNFTLPSEKLQPRPGIYIGYLVLCRSAASIRVLRFALPPIPWLLRRLAYYLPFSFAFYSLNSSGLREDCSLPCSMLLSFLAAKIWRCLHEILPSCRNSACNPVPYSTMYLYVHYVNFSIGRPYTKQLISDCPSIVFSYSAQPWVLLPL